MNFIIRKRGKAPIAIECKWAAKKFDAANLQAFARQYPKATMFVVTQDVERPYSQKVNGISVKFVSLPALVEAVADHTV